jgi:hypothetical protein
MVPSRHVAHREAPGARDEYHSSLPVVVSKLQQSTDAGPEIVAYVSSVEADRMGLKAHRQHADQVAELLIENRDWIRKWPGRWPRPPQTDD